MTKPSGADLETRSGAKPETKSVTVWVDADACPVKDEAMRVAGRHNLKIHFVSNAWMRLPEAPSCNG